MTGLKIGSLFSGYLGLDLAISSVLDAETVWVSDIDKGASKILAHRAPHAPNLGDLTQIDWTTVEPVDVITGGFPCQDLSHAGKRAGMTADTRSGLWSYMCEAIDKLRPRLVVAENVRGLLSAEALRPVEPCTWCVGDEPVFDVRALGAVLADLADIGYDASWYGLRAADVGACHGRFRVFLVAYPRGEAGEFGTGLRENESARDGRGLAARGDWPALLPTPRATDGSKGGPNQRGSSGDLMLPSAVTHLLPTPAGMNAANDPGSVESWRARRDRQLARGINGNGIGTPLGIAVQLLPTPTTQDGANDGGPSQYNRNTPPLNALVKLLPTPMADEARKAVTGQRASHRHAQGHQVWLTNAIHDFGVYAGAVARWESVTGRQAPAPTEPTGRDGAQRLSPPFVEWMMGLPDGWITDVPGITRNEALKACGNGVVPQQAAAALRLLLNVTEAAA